MAHLDNHALWQVATKALIFNDKGQLLTLMTDDGYTDFPGGRVDETEREIPWHQALQREIDEELGENIEIELGKTVFVSKRKYNRDGVDKHIAAIYFEAKYLGGDIEISEEHSSYAWIDPADLITSNHKFISDDEAVQIPAYVKERTGGYKS